MPEPHLFGSIHSALLAVGLILLAAHGLGSFLVRRHTLRNPRPAETTILRLALGLNLLAAISIALGQLGLLAHARALWLILLLSLLNLRHIRHAPQINPFPRLPLDALTKSSLPQIALAALCLTLLLATLGPALCPPVGWDELVYHSVLPQRWNIDGQPTVYLDLPYSGFPSLAETLFWLMTPIENVIAPRLLNWTCWVLALACVFRLFRQRLAPASAAVLLLAFALNDTLLLITENCYVESILLLNVAALLLAIARQPRAHSPQHPTYPILLGVLAGGAAATKLTGTVVLLVPCLWYAGQMWFNRNRVLATIGSLTICLTTAACVSLPFYLRPYLATGNPFYPYLAQWFTTDPARIDMSHYHHAIGGIGFGVKSLTAFIDGPILLAFSTDNYDGNFGWQLIGIVGLAILALLLLRRPRIRPLTIWPICIAACFYLFWFLTAQQARFAIPAVLAFLLLAALGLRAFHGRQRQLVLALLIILSLASTPWGRAGYYLRSFQTASGILSPADFVHNMTDRVYLPMVQATNALIPPDARLMLLYENRGLYIPNKHTIGTPLFQESPLSPPEAYSNPASIMKALDNAQITHMLVAKAPLGPDQPPGWFERQQPLLTALQHCIDQDQLHTIWESDTYFLFKVRTNN